MRKSLLINWVYYQPIGHAIEAYRVAQAFRQGNSDLEIGVAINARSGTELASCVPAVDRVYAINVDNVTSSENAKDALVDIPREWDFMYSDPRQSAPMGWDSLDYIAQAFRTLMRPGMVNDGWHTPDGFPAQRLLPLALDLPSEARRYAQAFVSPEKSVRISLLLGSGSDASRSPPVAFWRLLIQRLIAEFASIEIVLLGTLKPGRSVTAGVDQQLIDSVLEEFPEVRNAFDLGLLNQLAIAECCHLHISPHTGMSFAIQSVGVPWLALSGGEIHETVLNGVPFVSIYTDCPRYPCGPWFNQETNAMLSECEQRKADHHPFLCMTTDRLTQRLPDILRGARLLIENKLSYHDCVRTHYREMLPRLGEKEGASIFFDTSQVMSDEFIFPRRR